MRFRGTAKARPRPVPGTMNKTEQAYSDYLKAKQIAGEVQQFWFEGVKLRLAKLTTYSPDFLVMMPDNTLECHEVKGHWEDDARAKIKIAAEMFPFRFIAIKPKAKKDGGGWEVEEF